MKINSTVIKRLLIAAALIGTSFFVALICSGHPSPISAVIYQAAIGGALGGVAMIIYEAYRFICSLGTFGRIFKDNIRWIIGLLLLAAFGLPFFFAT